MPSKSSKAKSKTKHSPSKTGASDREGTSGVGESAHDGMTPDTEASHESVENMELDPPVPAPEPDFTPESPPEPETDESKPDLPRLPRIHLRVFEKVSGMKWDQFAGFRAYAKSNNLGPMTIPEWREAVQAYKNKPMS